MNSFYTDHQTSVSGTPLRMPIKEFVNTFDVKKEKNEQFCLKKYKNVTR